MLQPNPPTRVNLPVLPLILAVEVNQTTTPNKTQTRTVRATNKIPPNSAVPGGASTLVLPRNRWVRTERSVRYSRRFYPNHLEENT
jgi:hypothetical protein